jgi:hypothetical protein
MARPSWLGCTLVLAIFAALDPHSTSAQSPPLGGYGASTSSMASDGMGGSAFVIPYGGSVAGFMPYRMAGGSSLSYSSRSALTTGPGRTLFRLSLMSATTPMSSGTTGASVRLLPAGSLFSPALRGGMRQSIDTNRGSVMPPSFGYPFYQPPSLLPGSPNGIGMPSM